MLPVLPFALASWLLLTTCPSPGADPPTPQDLVAALETAVADAVARAEPSVVAIAREKSGKGDETLAVRGRNPAPRPPGFFPGAEFSRGETISFDYGSGVVVGDRGEILTAFHVVRGASRLTVKAAGREKFEAEVVAADPRSDLAVIAPREGPEIKPPKLTPIALGDASKLRKGSFLLALGNPYNAARDGKASASLGILANVARNLDSGNLADKQFRHYPTLLQLDAKLNLGMSGGAVINLRGELVGLTTNAANASGFDAQAGYAYPVDRLGRRVIETLKAGREVEYGLIGIRPDVSDPLAPGAVVGNVMPGTPASEGGLVVGDRIRAVNGLDVADFEALVLAVNAYAPGEPIKLKVLRDGETIEKTLSLSKFPVTGGEVISTNRPGPWRGLRVDYLSMLPQRADLGREINDAAARGGVTITEVIPGSPADVAGLRVGQVILGVGDKPAKSPAEFFRAASAITGPVDLLTESGRVTVR